MARYFPPSRNFSSLSVKDLLEAREAYHVHLAHLENVVATAIGRYRIRNTDPDYSKPTYVDGAAKRRRQKGRAGRRGGRDKPRTLQNTAVRPWSWPCVLVFVNNWLPRAAFAKEPDQMVPRTLYLPDGRVVPTCVLFAQEQVAPTKAVPRLNFPSNVVGGGYLLLSDVQGVQHTGSVGCLVTDGDMTYALTNRHVAGPGGREVYADIRGERVPLGMSDRKQVAKRPFDEIYPGWPGSRTLVNMDAGLIRARDASLWTTQVFGVGELAEPVDLNVDTISLDLIGCPVRAYGGASGVLVGEIQGLFYRYRSIGGSDDVSDLLIGPRTGSKEPMQTMHGDSGTLWFFDPPPKGAGGARGATARKAPQGDERPALRKSGPKSPATGWTPRLRPIAVQWGGHVVLDSATRGEFHYALATCLSTVCRALEVDVLRDTNIRLPEYWGPVGHYTVGAKACDLVGNARLRKFMQDNVDRISFNEGTILGGKVDGADVEGYFPLADVPDTVWKSSRPHEKPNHYADMDLEGKGAFAGRDLFEISKNGKNLKPKTWLDYYNSVGVAPGKQGSLPFRVWQIYDAMVGYVAKRDVLHFLAAAGVLAHYVGDACQPLHGTKFADGDPSVPESKGVHTSYETSMVRSKRVDLFKSLNSIVKTKKGSADVTGGHGAAVSIVKLMRQTRATLSPEDVITSYVDNNHHTGPMWDDLGKRTARVVAAGCLRLASLWESAWAEGGGGSVPNSKLKVYPKPDLRHVCESENATFVPSMYLPEMADKPAMFPDPP